MFILVTTDQYSLKRFNKYWIVICSEIRLIYDKGIGYTQIIIKIKFIGFYISSSYI